MTRQVTPQRAIAFAKIMLKITYCWPPPATASKIEIIRFKALRAFLIFSAFLQFLPMSYAIFKNMRNFNPLILVKVVGLTSASVQIIVQTLVCAVNFKELQSLIFEIEEYVRVASPWEKKVLQQYTNKYARIYGVFMIWFYLNALSVITGPLFLPNQKFPTDAKYPFSVDTTSVKIILYTHQSLVILQIAGHVCMNGFVALFLWFTAARYKILSIEMQRVGNISEMHACIKAHQSLLRYTDKVIHSVRFISLIAVIVSFISLIFDGLILLVPTPPEAKLQFTLMNTIAILEVLMISWPADHLMNSSSGIGNAIYNSKWYESPIDVQKTMICTIMRCRKPVVVSVGGILPPMSLNYLATYISSAFSYFTALRIMVVNDS